MKKKIIALMLATTMIMSTLVGCGQAQDNEETKTAGTAEATKEDTAETDAEPAAPEMETIKVLAYNLEWAGTASKDWESTFVGQYFKEQLAEIGITLDIEFVAQNDFDNVLNTRMASQTDIPDLICNPWGDVTVMTEWGEKGLIHKVNDLLEQYDADGSIRAFYEQTPGSWELSTLADGTTYWFSNINANIEPVDKATGKVTPWYNTKNLLIRKDWIEAVGEEYKPFYTPDELFDLLKKMQDEDANGNGKKDEVVNVYINNFHNGFVLPWGLNSKTTGGYIQGEDKVFVNFEHENFPEYIKYMNKLYEAGLYDTEALSISVNEMVAQNRVALTFDYTWMSYEDVLSTESNYQPIYLDLDGDPSTGYYEQIDYYGPSVFSGWIIPTKSEKVEAVMRFMDYIYSDEYARLSQFGVEGYGYELNDDGSVTNITGTDESKSLDDVRIGQHVFPCFYVTPAVQGIVTSEKEKPLAREQFKYTDMTEYFYKNLEEHRVVIHGSTYAIATPEEAAVISEYSTTLSTYCGELLTDLILGRKSLDDLDTYIEEMNELGMQEYLAARQAQRDRAVGK